MKLSEYLASANVSQGAFAERVGVTQGAVWQWIAGRKPVSAESCIAIERETGGAVRCEELRPDIDWSVLRGPRKQRAKVA